MSRVANASMALSVLALLLIAVWVYPSLLGLQGDFAKTEGQAAEFSKRVDELKAGLSRIEESNKQLRASLDSAISKIGTTGEGEESKTAQLAGQLNALTGSIEEMKVQVSSQVKNLGEKLEAASASVAGLREENTRLRGELAKLQEEYSRLNAQVGSSAARVFEVSKQGVVSITVYSESGNQMGVGSGFVYSKDGHVVTNNHVAEVGPVYLLTFLDGSQVRASLVGKDLQGDIAVLTAKLPSFARPLELADSNRLKVGESVFAIGSPQGLVGSMTSGIVSQLNRTVSDFSFLFYIQTDAPINPGNSGGPLLNVEGKVVGINTWGIEKSLAEGLNFAIPSNILSKVIPQLIEKGSYKYPLIGITGRFLDPIRAASMNLPSSVTTGWLVERITTGSGAARSNLKIGDIILSIGGHGVRFEHDIAYILNLLYSPGEKVVLNVQRGEQRLDIEVTLGSR